MVDGIDMSAFLGGKDTKKTAEVIEKLYTDENLPYITDLSVNEIKSIATILFLADFLDLAVFKTFVENIMKLKVSKNRRGRAEFIEAFKELRKDDKLLEKLKSRSMLM